MYVGTHICTRRMVSPALVDEALTTAVLQESSASLPVICIEKTRLSIVFDENYFFHLSSPDVCVHLMFVLASSS